MNKKILSLLIVAFAVLLLEIIYYFFFKPTNPSLQPCLTNSVIVNNLSDFKQCDFKLISLSDSYAASEHGPYVFTGSIWVNWTHFVSRLTDLESSDTNQMLRNLFDKSWINQSLVYYDEFDGRKAWFMVFLLRSLWKNDVYLLDWDKLRQTLTVNDNISYESDLDFWDIDELKKQYNTGYVDWWRYWVVFDPNLVQFNSWDLLVYTSDEWWMINDEFYKNNSDKINIKNLYWSDVFDVGSQFVDKEQFQRILKRNNIDFNWINDIYFYYPTDWYKSWLIALFIKQYLWD